MADTPIDLAQAMDRCWLERRYDDLHACLAPEVVISVPGVAPVVGIEAVIDTYRDFMSRCEVLSYEPAGHVETIRGDAAIVEYRWDMVWQEAKEEITAAGREILALQRSDTGWTIFWRTQLPG